MTLSRCPTCGLTISDAPGAACPRCDPPPAQHLPDMPVHPSAAMYAFAVALGLGLWWLSIAIFWP